MTFDDAITFSDAARDIGCSRTTLHRAVDDGRLNDVEVGGRRMIFKDEAWEAFEPVLTGGRVQMLKREGIEEDE
jgi:excisionase family DNA binding protein